MRQPYLIQRAVINSPLMDGKHRLSDAVKLEYMGSAEFEFGALPKSLRSLQSVQKNLKQRLVPEIMEGEHQLRVLSAMNDEEFETYKGYLLRLRNSKGLGKNSIHLKEHSGFDLAFPKSKWDETNFWWDLDNHVMFSFHKIFMNRLMEHLNASWVYMDEQKKKD